MHRAVFLDRDNTIIHNDGDLGDPCEVKLMQGAASAIASLRGLGYRVVVVTNQGGVARGKFTEADVDAVNQRIVELVREQSGGEIDRFYYCPYHPEAVMEQYRREHPWRKPQPGMILQAAKDLDLDLRYCWMVGDQQRDVAAGKAAGVQTILLGDMPGGDEAGVRPDFAVRNIVEAVRVVAQHPRGVEPAVTLPPRSSRGVEDSVTATHAEATRTQESIKTEAAVDKPGNDPKTHDLLKSLEREIKRRDLLHDDFSWVGLVAPMLQVVAVGCAVFALFNDPRSPNFFAWVLGAIFVQLVVIAALLSKRN